MRQYSDLITFYSPLENLSDVFPVKVTISRLKFTQDISLDEYTNYTLAAFNRSNQINLMESNSTTVGGYRGHGAVLGYSVTQNGNINHFYTLNVWTVVNNSEYTLTYEGEVSKFKIQLTEFVRMLNSLQIPTE